MDPAQKRAREAAPPGEAVPPGGAETLARSLERIHGLGERAAAVRREIAKAIVGQDRVVEEILIALLAGGHALLEGVPGLAKTLLVSTVARVTDLSFNRIQFTPDLMPADITGTQVIQPSPASGERTLGFRPGPIFASVILADEINRTPPKTQAALLEAMQEGQVTAGGVKHPLPHPFLVLATQNPIEQEGTYPLPEAQRDRFLFHVAVDYPSLDEERGIVIRTTGLPQEGPRPVLSAQEILALKRIVRALPVSDPLTRYATDLVRHTRPDDPSAPEEVKRWVAWGAGPRAVQALLLAGKARALLQGRFAVTRADLRAVALPALRHRLVPNFRAEAEGIGSDELVGFVLGTSLAGLRQEIQAYDARTRKLLRL
jgi:MoxR-like ATPase